MPRPRKLWERAGTGHYYTKIDGVQTRLEPVSKGMAASQRKLETLLRGNVPDADPGMSFSALAERFLTASEATNERETYEVHRLYLQSFKDHVGKRKVGRLCEADLDEWCRKHTAGGGKVRAGGRKVKEGEKERTRAATAWSENTQARARAIVLACLNYGTKKLNLPAHPLTHTRPGSCARRERILSDEERQHVRAAVHGAFGEYVTALELTGARPFSEVAQITAADVDLTTGTWMLKKWKNSRKKKGVKRIIYLVPKMLEITRRLAALYPEGPLFRNHRGRPWTRQALTARFRALGASLGIEDLTAYCVRHGYITDALARGVAVAVVAELCGTSIQTIEKHYRHLDVKHDVLREAALRAVGG